MKRTKTQLQYMLVIQGALLMNSFQTETEIKDMICEPQPFFQRKANKVCACFWRRPHDSEIAKSEKINTSATILYFPIIYSMSEEGLLPPPPPCSLWDKPAAGRSAEKKKKPPLIPNVKKPVQLTFEDYFKRQDD